MKNRKIDWMNVIVWGGILVLTILIWYGIYRIFF